MRSTPAQAGQQNFHSPRAAARRHRLGGAPPKWRGERRGAGGGRCRRERAGHRTARRDGAALAPGSDDVEVLDALLDAGADIDAPGAVVAGGSPLRDATAFGQWSAARRLVERGARTTSFDAAALGLVDRLEADFALGRPAEEELDDAFWAACHGGQRQTAEYLLARGPDLGFIPGWEELTPLDAAARSGATDVLRWLRAHRARSAVELRQDS